MEDGMAARIKRLREIKEKALLGAGEIKLAEQKAKGKLSARERLNRLLDPGSFVDLGSLVYCNVNMPGDGLVAGHGTIDGRRVCVYSQDATVLGGTVGITHGYRMFKTVETAIKMGVPVIGLHDSPGARGSRIGEEPVQRSTHQSGQSLFGINTHASGVVPQIAAVLGSCAGISVYSPALCDFILMVDKTSHMFITGPRIVKSVIAQDLTLDQLGGAEIHAKVSGVADFRAKNEEDLFSHTKKLLSFLPNNNKEKPPWKDTGDDPNRLDDTLTNVLPADHNQGYDIRRIIRAIADNGDFLEVKEEFAANIVTGFIRLDGFTVGIVANQPQVLGGSLTGEGSRKEARHIRFCDCFNIPLLFLVDTPGCQPGEAEERGGLIHKGGMVLFALAESVVPRVNLLIRKCYGLGHLNMGVHPALMADFTFAWPSVETGIMDVEGTVDLFYQKEVNASENPTQKREQLIKELRDKYSNPFDWAFQTPQLHDVIEPRETRRTLTQAFRLLQSKSVTRQPKKHGNMPL